MGLATFLVVPFATFFNYPLLAWVGRVEPVPFYRRDYQRGLPVGIQAPYSLLVAADAPPLFLRPPEVAVG